MTNNDILRRFRYAVDLDDGTMVDVFAHAGEVVDETLVRAFMAREDDSQHQPLNDAMLDAFLDGLILYTRGPQPDGVVAVPRQRLNNNVILRKIRIALQLREEDMLDLFAHAGFPLSRAELSALFRRPGHKNYKVCGDQILRNFLNGLTIHNRR